MANKTFSRGIETLGAEASMAFVGNTQHTVAHMLRHSDLFDELPTKFHDSAFLDRMHFFVPGWEVDILRGDMYTSDFGFVVDYLAEILKQQRNFDYSHLYATKFHLSEQISTRDRDAINKTFSGLVKIIFPNQDATTKELEELLVFSIEGRKRVKDQLMRIDQTYADVRFAYTNADGQDIVVKTLEEELYPSIYYKSGEPEPESAQASAKPESPQPTPTPTKPGPEEGHVTVKENQRGIDFDTLFGPYVVGATKIVLTDPYIRIFHQARNLMEFIETVARVKPDDERVEIELITSEEEFNSEKQLEFFEKIQKNCLPIGILFSWTFESTIHARHIVTDTGWKILLDRGLDVFQRYDANDSFAISNRLQKHRTCKAFEVTYLRI
jgi:ATP-dependent Lon protease